jgi:hypothetical protein
MPWHVCWRRRRTPAYATPRKRFKSPPHLHCSNRSPHLRLLALTEAAGGRFDEALETQTQAIAMSPWLTAPQEQTRMQTELQGYQRSELPQPAWPPDGPLLSPPPFDPVAPFRDYPAAVPHPRFLSCESNYNSKLLNQ